MGKILIISISKCSWQYQGAASALQYDFIRLGLHDEVLLVLNALA